ncbi:MAG: putative glycine dehydrogenase (decarboxylating) subunit 1 [Rhodomicrobium sp.]|nr:MAG: putative glycine dehydrogenase (decarboxylating) subunit 1 [Rhodomicrobium sp.]
MRYLPHTKQSREAMLEAIGVSSIDQIFKDAGAPQIALDDFALPKHLSEMEVERHMAALAAQNRAAGAGPFFVGCGAYKHHVPASVDHLIQRSEFLTSYTPYQPEISQGTLQYLFEFQTQVAALLGGEIANASLYDGSTGCGEAVLMAHRLTRRKKAVLAGNLHPQYGAVVKTLSDMSGFEVVDGTVTPGGVEDLSTLIDDETSCVVVQTPDIFGTLHDLTKIAETAQAKGALLIAVVTEVVSLGAVKSPGSMGADIIVAEGQSIGNGLNFGGPYLGLLATRHKFVRQMPGRVCGETVDADGERGYVLTLSTREQHIRREKATSNICTNSGLCCLAFTIHMTLLGEKGLTKLSRLNHAKAVQLSQQLAEIEGVTLLNDQFFNEFTLKLEGRDAAEVTAQLAAKDILAGVPGGRLWPERDDVKDLLIVAVTETVTDADFDALVAGLKEALNA